MSTSKQVKNSKRRPLTAREKKLVNFLALNPGATLDQAGKYAGYPDANTAQRTYDALSKVSVREEMAKAMEEDQDLSNAALRWKLKEGLNATVKERSFDRNGNHVEEFEDPDMQTRRSYLQLIGKWKGLELEKHEISGPNGGPIPVESLDALKGLTKEDLAKIIAATAPLK